MKFDLRVLVTGGDTGFGKVLVQKLYNKGDKVAATSRNLPKLSSSPDNIDLTPM